MSFCKVNLDHNGLVPAGSCHSLLEISSPEIEHHAIQMKGGGFIRYTVLAHREHRRHQSPMDQSLLLLFELLEPVLHHCE